MHLSCSSGLTWRGRSMMYREKSRGLPGVYGYGDGPWILEDRRKHFNIFTFDGWLRGCVFTRGRTVVRISRGRCCSDWALVGRSGGLFLRWNALPNGWPLLGNRRCHERRESAKYIGEREKWVCYISQVITKSPECPSYLCLYV